MSIVHISRKRSRLTRNTVVTASVKYECNREVAPLYEEKVSAAEVDRHLKDHLHHGLVRDLIGAEYKAQISEALHIINSFSSQDHRDEQNQRRATELLTSLLKSIEDSRQRFIHE